MNTVLYYFSGTGNSLWVARELAARLPDGAELVSLSGRYPLPAADCDRLGLVFPVHVWGVPRRVIDFVRQLQVGPECYIFAMAVNAGQVAGTLLQLETLLAGRQQRLSAGFDLCMPSNYIPWGGAQPDDKQTALFAAARGKLAGIATTVDARATRPVEKGPWWQNFLFSRINRWSFDKVPALDKDFWLEERCQGCGLCAKLCPANNIELTNHRPVWRNHCEQCLACLQWCPQEAIQYGKKTAGKKRYHHPAIAAADLQRGT